MTANELITRPFNYEDPNSHLTLAGKCYTVGAGQELSSDGLTLLLIHATGMRMNRILFIVLAMANLHILSDKEQFEPMLASLLASPKPAESPLREAIAFDSLTSGDTAALNQDALSSGKGESEWS